jgi:hypothetical protein
MGTAATTAEKASAAPATVIDRAHLARITFGDRCLEGEVLQLFDRQAMLLMARIGTSAPAAVASLAHTLKGSAASIGAVNVARAAEAAELAAPKSASACNAAVGQLGAAVDEARAAINEMLRTL